MYLSNVGLKTTDQLAFCPQQTLNKKTLVIKIRMITNTDPNPKQKLFNLLRHAAKKNYLQVSVVDPDPYWICIQKLSGS